MKKHKYQVAVKSWPHVDHPLYRTNAALGSDAKRQQRKDRTFYAAGSFLMCHMQHSRSPMRKCHVNTDREISFQSDSKTNHRLKKVKRKLIPAENEILKIFTPRPLLSD